MKYLIRFFAPVLIFLSASFSFAGEGIGLPMLKNFSPETYKGGIQNWQILQDSKGIIYVANNFGLLQYDGNDWRTYVISSASKLRSLAIHHDNRIFVGGQGDFGYFKTDSIGLLHYVSLKSKIPESFNSIGETWRTYIVKDKVYFCTFSTIYIYENDKIDIINPGLALDVSFLCENTIYTQILGVGLHKIDGKNLILPIGLDFFKDKIISSVLNIDKDKLLITTAKHGIYTYQNGELEPFLFTTNEILKKAFINSAILLSDGNLAIGTQNNGVFIIDLNGEIEIRIDKDRGIRSSTILSLFEDENNNLWVGQNNGISFIQLKSPFSRIDDDLGIQGTGYVAQNINSTIYLGTNNGVFYFKDNQFNFVTGSEGQVYNIQEINKSILLSHNDGAFKISNFKAEKIIEENGSWTFLENNGYLLQGTYEGINIIDKNNFSKIGEIESFKESSRLLLKESENTIWMSHGYKGLYKLILPKNDPEKAKITFYNSDSGLPSNQFNSVVNIEGELKIHTENGIYNFNPETERFNIDPQLNSYFANDAISDLKSDIYGNIYFITENSLGYLEKLNQGEYKRVDKAFDQIRILLNDDLPNISFIGPNDVLFAAKEGFILFDKNKVWTLEKEIFHTVLRSVTSKEDSIELLSGGNIHLAHNKENNTVYPKIPFRKNTISFLFSSTSYSTTYIPQFQFRLVGYEREWSEWTENNFKEYTNLKEGSYTFQVKSKNSNSVESEITEFSFIIVYPWYRSPVAYVIYVLIGILSLITLIVSLDRRYEMEKKRLDQKRLDQLNIKDQELNTITKKSEAEIEHLKNDKLKSEIKYMNSELATNTMHLLNKNEFINSIKSNLENLVKESTNTSVKSQIKKIIKNIEKNIQKDGDWDNFQIHFDKVHGDFSKRIQTEYPNLSPQEIKLSAYLRLNLSTKEIANLLNISVRGVEIARYRLRKKLLLERSQSLAEFILNY